MSIMEPDVEIDPIDTSMAEVEDPTTDLSDVGEVGDVGEPQEQPNILNLSKACYGCRVEKGLTQFSKDSARKDGRQGQCKECKSAYMKDYWKKREGLRRKYQVAQYGLSDDNFESMLEAQGGVCAICGQGNGKRNLCVDHDHVSGRVRALLCTPCNAGIGNFKEDLELLFAAADYLVNQSVMEEACLI